MSVLFTDGTFYFTAIHLEIQMEKDLPESNFPYSYIVTLSLKQKERPSIDKKGPLQRGVTNSTN